LARCEEQPNTMQGPEGNNNKNIVYLLTEPNSNCSDFLIAAFVF